MSPADVAACAEQLRSFLVAQEQSWANTSDRHFGTILHNLDQLRVMSERMEQGWIPRLEQVLQAHIRLPGAGAGTRDVNAVADLISVRVGKALLDELKTGGTTPAALRGQIDVEQILDHMMVLLRPRSFGVFRESMEAVWSLTDAHLSTQSEAILLQQMEKVVGRLKDMGFTEPDIQNLLSRFHFRFAEAAESGAEGALGPAMEVIFGQDGKLALAATKEASGSPNFGPAMEAVLGPTGKLANAATQAAEGANFTTAQTELEQKVEKSVTTALERAGTAAADKAGAKVGKKIAGGLTALGNVMTSIPQLYSGIKDLGEVWDKPNKGADDYMKLMSSLGGIVMGLGQTIQAFSAIQEIATGVQAAFNAVAAMNPYVLIALAVIALIAGIVLLIVYWDKVKAAIRDNPWIAVIAVMFGVIGVIILVIAYWDEIKLAVLKAANFVSIQMQRVGGFFIGVKNLAGMVWDWIVATVENVGIGILNAFITIGVGIQNFFIGVINWVLKQYNKVADSAIGSVLGLSKADLLPEVDVKTKLIPPKEVPKVDVEAAFKPMTEEKTGGLEGQIAKQQAVVDKAKKDDEDRRAKEAKEKADKEKAAAAAPPGAPAGLAPPAIPGMPPGAPGVPAAFAGPPGAAAAMPPAAGGGGVTIQGGITVTINADKLEADASKILSDEIVQALNTKLQALQGDANRRLGAAAAA